MTPHNSDRTKSIATGTFTVPPSAHAWQDMKSLACRYWYIPVLPLIINLFGIAGWRGWIVAMMILFILLPIAALFAWIAVLGRKEAVRAMYPQRLSAIPGRGISVIYSPMHQEADDSDPAVSSHVCTQYPAPCVIPYSSITGHTTTKSYIIVRYTAADEPKTPSTHRLIIPLNAFRSDTDAIDFLRFLPYNLN